jgi:small subunit ribosomal protein S17
MTNTCDDRNCPVHGTLVTKGAVFSGTVVSDKMNKTVTVQWSRRIYIPKYERYQVRLSKIKAHNPPCINAKVGDYVNIQETRPLSKTKNFIVTQIVGKGKIIEVKHEELLTKKERESLKKKEEAKAKKAAVEDTEASEQ